MENQAFNFTPDNLTRNSLVMDGISQQSTTNSFVQSYFFDHHADLHGAMNQQAANLSSANAFYSYNKRNVAREALLGCGGGEFQDTPSLQENLNNLAISLPPIYSSQLSLADYAPNHCSNASNSSAMTCIGHDEVLGVITGQWDMEKYSATLQHPYTSVNSENLNLNGWISPENSARFAAVQSYGSSKFSNELSLTLATSQPSVMSIDPGQCSDMANSSSETMLAASSDRTSGNSEDLSLSFGSYRAPPPQFSQAILGSSYLSAVQEILAQIASFTLENVDHRGAGYLIASAAAAGTSTSTPSSSNCPTESRMSLAESSSEQRRHAVEAKKAKLLALLQMVDDRYNQCVDEIHTVISAFHAATELDPQIHARFALQTISFLYKSLRERISSQCLAMGASFDPTGDSERSFETDFIQKQWALQQMKKKEHQLWRPQRGLPEKSVAVLRAWMFQNFLHPYPKDAEKHLLAIKSGLTRNQVSNWFINARVRLWKPMIEEMYAEMSRRKTRRNENNESNQRSLTSSSKNNSLRYNVN